PRCLPGPDRPVVAHLLGPHSYLLARSSDRVCVDVARPWLPYRARRVTAGAGIWSHVSRVCPANVATLPWLVSATRLSHLVCERIAREQRACRGRHRRRYCRTQRHRDTERHRETQRDTETDRSVSCHVGDLQRREKLWAHAYSVPMASLRRELCMPPSIGCYRKWPESPSA